MVIIYRYDDIGGIVVGTLIDYLPTYSINRGYIRSTCTGLLTVFAVLCLSHRSNEKNRTETVIKPHRISVALFTINLFVVVSPDHLSTAALAEHTSFRVAQ